MTLQPYSLEQIPGAPLGLPPFAPEVILGKPNFARADKTTVDPLQKEKGLKRAVSYVADHGGCAWYRIIAPDLFLNLYQKSVMTHTMSMVVDPRFYTGLSCVKLQRQVSPGQLAFARLMKKLSETYGFKIVYEVDDVVFYEDIPMYNKNREPFARDEIRNSAIEIMQLADEITVTTPYFRDYISAKCGNKNVSVVPNYLPRLWFDRYYNLGNLVKNFEKNKKKPVITIFSAATHIDVLNKANQKDDFEKISQAMIRTRKDFTWQFYGAYPLAVRPFVKSGEMIAKEWTPLVDFPRAMAESGTQMSFATLQPNEFNHCKSPIKILESAAMGYPCACPDMVTYKDSWLKYNTGEELIDVIKAVTKNQTVYAEHCKKARQYVESFWLEDEPNLMKHWEASFTPFKSPDRKFLLE